MKIQSIDIKHYKAFYGEHTLKLSGKYVFIYGENGSGKSSLYYALKDFFQSSIEGRHQTASTILCSQIPVSGWHKVIGEGTIADAILDRVVYSSHRLELKGESLQKTTLDHMNINH